MDAVLYDLAAYREKRRRTHHNDPVRWMRWSANREIRRRTVSVPALASATGLSPFEIAAFLRGESDNYRHAMELCLALGLTHGAAGRAER